MEDFLYFNCPHCSLGLIIKKTELNCHIFRHGIYNNGSFEQINPHLDQISCENLVKENKIYGCGKPFEIKLKQSELNIIEYEIVICDYK